MTPSTQIDIGPVALAIVLSRVLFGPELAEFIGPYSVIFLGAVLGGALSASRRGETSRWETLRYMALVIVLALLITVPLAELVASNSPARIEPRALFAPLAAIVAGIGHEWPRVGMWFLNLLRGLIERKVGASPSDREGPTP